MSLKVHLPNSAGEKRFYNSSSSKHINHKNILMNNGKYADLLIVKPEVKFSTLAVIVDAKMVKIDITNITELECFRLVYLIIMI